MVSSVKFVPLAENVRHWGIQLSGYEAVIIKCCDVTNVAEAHVGPFDVTVSSFYLIVGVTKSKNKI